MPKIPDSFIHSADVTSERFNQTTITAMSEAEQIAHNPKVKHYSDVEEALQELKK